MFGPLVFPVSESESQSISKYLSEGASHRLQCILCRATFNFPKEHEQCLSHLKEEHKLVIENVDQIPNLIGYFEFWRKTFSEIDLNEFFTKKLGPFAVETAFPSKDDLFILSELIPEDKQTRRALQRAALDEALEQQKREREDCNFSKGCLFCKQVIGPTRSEYLGHLASQHNLQLGKPDNLVFIDELIAIVENKLDRLQCIKCEKTFKDRNVLKEHMRKKLHKRVNPKNTMYDRFYIINYLEMSQYKRKTNRLSPDGDGDNEDGDACDWDDWKEELKVSIVCLFCEQTCLSWEETLEHMLSVHQFNYEASTEHLSFYEQVKLVNFIRRQVYKNACISCEGTFSSSSELLKHLNESGHLKLPDKKLWNQPEYYFPTYENDAFLCQLEDTPTLSEQQDIDIDEHVVGEDFRPPSSDLDPSLLRECTNEEFDAEEEEGSNTDNEGQVDDNCAEWSDWSEQVVINITCLFCESQFTTWEAISQHMKKEHEFDYENSTTKLNFYEQIKLVNYIRKQFVKLCCLTCDFKASSRSDLDNHLKASKHIMVPGKDVWDKPEYFIPTLENDMFLSQIDDNSDDMGNEPSVTVICEGKEEESSLQTSNTSTVGNKEPVMKIMEEMLVETDESGDEEGSDKPAGVVNGDFQDWEDEEVFTFYCLFCDYSIFNWPDIQSHMASVHNFSYQNLLAKMPFYSQIQIVNYIRRQVLNLKCINCAFVGTSKNNLLDHMKTSDHFGLPNKSQWEKDEYMIPTMENDAVLFQLDDSEDDDI